MKVRWVYDADIQRHWFTEMEALITGTNTRVMWGRQSRTREAPTGEELKWRPLRIRLRKCAEQKAVRAVARVGAPAALGTVSQMGRWVRGSRDSSVQMVRWSRFFVCWWWFPFCCSEAHSCCLSAQKLRAATCAQEDAEWTRLCLLLCAETTASRLFSFGTFRTFQSGIHVTSVLLRVWWAEADYCVFGPFIPALKLNRIHD